MTDAEKELKRDRLKKEAEDHYRLRKEKEEEDRRNQDTINYYMNN